MSKSIDESADFDFVRYANCWEDADILLEALQPAPGKSYASIASSGDNSLSLLVGAPRRVVAFDLSLVQIACLELRRAAICVLDDDALLAFLGVKGEGEHRLDVYRSNLRAKLSKSAQAIWDARPADIQGGIIHCGKFENYFRIFRQYVLPLIHSKKTVRQLFLQKDGVASQAFHREKWDTWRWRLTFRLFFSRLMLGRLGRDSAFFRHVEGPVAERLLARTDNGMRDIPAAENPYLSYILTGTFTHALPHYLRPENLALIRKNIGALEIFHGSADDLFDAHPDCFDGFNLSDVFEYMNEKQFEHTVERILGHSARGARIAYWNMLVPRAAHACRPTQIRHLPELSNRLFARDRAWFYNRFFVNEVMGKADFSDDKQIGSEVTGEVRRAS